VTSDRFFALLLSLYGSDSWPKPLHKFQGLERVRQGEDILQAAKAVSTTKAALEAVIASADPVACVLGSGFDAIDEPHRRKAKQALGQMLLGKCAEEAFEQIYRSGTQWQEFSLRDDRQGRTDTDYFICNGQGRQVYRINIKFHGALFRRALETVGLEPEDCFALATYKINSALAKQEAESLPYFFAIVGVRHLTAETVGDSLREDLLDAAALMHQAPKHPSVRGFEDAIVDHLVATKHATYTDTLQKIQKADWYILSARRADMLLHKLLFKRVFALTVRNFTRAFPGAEVDMHFSLSQDLIPLQQFLQTLRDEGPHSVTTRLERGDF
jgi:hypothetical protein